jgi:hypothetical protein
MAAAPVRDPGARIAGPAGADDLLALRAGSPLDVLAYFTGLRVAFGGDYGTDLSSGRLDAALLYCCRLADDALDRLAMVAALTPHARSVTVAVLREWARGSGSSPPTSQAAAMAFLEAFKQHSTCPPLDRGSFAPAVLSPLDTLAPGVQLKAVRATLKTFSSATLAEWCPGGDTTLLALALQAIDGPLLTGGAGWTPDKRAQTVAVLRSLRRRAGSHASAGEVLATVHDVLRSRALSLHVTHRPGQFERLVAPLPGDPFDPPIPAYLALALARLPLATPRCARAPQPSGVRRGRSARPPSLLRVPVRARLRHPGQPHAPRGQNQDNARGRAEQGRSEPLRPRQGPHRCAGEHLLPDQR